MRWCPYQNKPLMGKVLYETRHVELRCWWVLLPLLFKGEHDFNYWLYFSQPPRKIHELVLTSCDLTQLLQSQKPVSERHTPALVETLTPCLLPRTHLWAVYLYNTQHKALLGNLKLFLGNSKHPSSISRLSFPLQLFKMRMTSYVLLPVSGLPLASNR